MESTNILDSHFLQTSGQPRDSIKLPITITDSLKAFTLFTSSDSSVNCDENISLSSLIHIHGRSWPVTAYPVTKVNFFILLGNAINSTDRSPYCAYIKCRLSISIH